METITALLSRRSDLVAESREVFGAQRRVDLSTKSARGDLDRRVYANWRRRRRSLRDAHAAIGARRRALDSRCRYGRRAPRPRRQRSRKSDATLQRTATRRRRAARERAERKNGRPAFDRACATTLLERPRRHASSSFASCATTSHRAAATAFVSASASAISRDDGASGSGFGGCVSSRSVAVTAPDAALFEAFDDVSRVDSTVFDSRRERRTDHGVDAVPARRIEWHLATPSGLEPVARRRR
jgi:hypothetical protein